MGLNLAVPVARFLLIGALFGAGASYAAAQCVETTSRRDDTVYKRTAILAAIADWPGCAPYRDTQQVTWLCKESAGTVDTNAINYLNAQLYAYPRYLASLCELDASVVQAQHDCRNPQIAGMMRWLADNWKRHRVFERADQLYAHAHLLSTVDNPSGLWTSAVLRNWADLKVMMGNAEAARKLAREHTELARLEYKTGKFPDTQTGLPSITHVTDALRFEADILERLGFDGEAHALREEAESLSSVPERCEGVCGG